MSEKRRGLGRGLGALIPSATPAAARPSGDRPVDVFFPDREEDAGSVATLTAPAEAKSAPGEATAQPAPGGAAPGGPGSDEKGKADTTHAVPTSEESRPGGQAPSEGTDSAGAAPDRTVELVPVPGARFAEIPVGSISPNAKQPRQVFDEEALAELVHSVREIGILQPIVVRAVSSDRPGEPAYELIMGERRWRAAKLAGLDVVPAIVRETSDDDMLRDALLENLHRSQLNPLEEAAAYQQLLDDFGCTHDELAARIGRSRPQISNTIRLLKLPPQVQRRVAAGVLSAGHARALLGLEDLDAMDALALRIVAEGLSVRAVEEIVALGDGKPAKPRPKKPRAGGRQVELNDLASRLGDRLDTRVTISLGRTKGKLSVEFASVEDLNRILALISPEERRAFEASQA